jgi:hypothetical protein
MVGWTMRLTVTYQIPSLAKGMMGQQRDIYPPYTGYTNYYILTSRKPNSFGRSGREELWLFAITLFSAKLSLQRNADQRKPVARIDELSSLLPLAIVLV